MADEKVQVHLDVIEFKSRLLLKEGINFDTRTIRFEGPISSKSARQLISSIEMLESMSNKQITIIIDSDGGCVYSMFKIIDKFHTSNCTIRTVGTGMVASAAVPMLAAGDIRACTANAFFMIHDIGYAVTHTKRVIHKIELEHTNSLSERYQEVLLNNTQMSKDYLAKMCGPIDHYLDSEDALNLGIVDKILKRKTNK